MHEIAGPANAARCRHQPLPTPHSRSYRDAPGRSHVTQDVKESLTAWFSVTLMFGLSWLALRLDIIPDIPRWATHTLFAVETLVLFVVWVRWLWRRRRLRQADGPTH